MDTFCTLNKMFKDKACNCNYENGDAQFAAGMRVMTVNKNTRVEQRGPTGINQPRKTETSRPTQKEDKHPFKINIRLNLKDYLFYLSTKGSVAIHGGHVRHSVTFARGNQINKNVEKMLNDFEFANAKPFTASRVLHHMYDHIYDPNAISNIIAKSQKTWLSDRGININPCQLRFW
jgi:hypothetical protein